MFNNKETILIINHVHRRQYCYPSGLHFELRQQKIIDLQFSLHSTELVIKKQLAIIAEFSIVLYAFARRIFLIEGNKSYTIGKEQLYKSLFDLLHNDDRRKFSSFRTKKNFYPF